MDALRSALTALIDPISQKTLAQLNAIQELQETAQGIEVKLQFPFANGQFVSRLRESELSELTRLAQGRQLIWKISHQLTVQPGERMPNLAQVKQIIAVSSGKGGVGKSTTAVNLALALVKEGAKVALLDADIYGPSIPLMLGCEGETPNLVEGQQVMYPIEAHDLKVNSVGFLVAADTATVWRGPMASGVLQQLLRDTRWGEVDYLVVDMPPGTGDIQLTLAQVVPVSAAVIVTTPQTIALADAVKGVAMYQKVNVPVAGVIENMSFHICSNCGHHDYLFGQGGGERVASLYEVPLLGCLPLDKQIGEDVDQGNPTVVAQPASELSHAYQATAAKTAFQVWQQGQAEAPQVRIEITDD